MEFFFAGFQKVFTTETHSPLAPLGKGVWGDAEFRETAV
ncbi:hypothetical protein CKA32_002912 [Geitlerinema sp. FC II]|nr:hypothetical protein CKA32_002912 [Geitlerinema sp. FC II]